MFDLGCRFVAKAVLVGTLFVVPTLLGQEVGEWNGVAIAPEQRCAPYDRADYRYPQSVEPQIVAGMGGSHLRTVYGQALREHGRDADRTHRGALGSPRFRRLRLDTGPEERFRA